MNLWPIKRFLFGPFIFINVTSYKIHTLIDEKCVISKCFLNKHYKYNSMCWARLTCMAVAARQRFAFFFSRDFNLVASAVNEHWHQEQYVFEIVFFQGFECFVFSIYFRFFFLPFVILLCYYFLLFAVLMIAISVTLMTTVICSISFKKDVLILNTNSVT